MEKGKKITRRKFIKTSATVAAVGLSVPEISSAITREKQVKESKMSAKMKLSLDIVGYAGYFTNGENISIEEAMKRAAGFGYDAVCIYAHRPIAFPMDISADRRKKIKFAWSWKNP